MNQRSTSLAPSAVLAGALLLVPSMAGALGVWNLYLTNEAAVDWYDVAGDEANSPLQFEGTFWSNRVRLELGFEDAEAGRLLRIEGEALGADDEYLEQDGAVLELFRVGWEDGGLALPLRIAAGDVFAELSRRTLQRDIRGATLEIQPRLPGQHSLLLTSGTGVPQWRDTFDDGDDLRFHGGSYLFATPSGRSSLVLGFVDALQRPAAIGASPVSQLEREQQIWSLYGETRVAGLLLEGEVAMLDGQREEADLQSESFYAQLSKEGRRLGWKVRVEENGQDFQPIGGYGVLDNRRIGEAHGRLLLGRRGTLRARLQHIENQFEGERPEVTTEAVGLHYDGRPWPRRASMTLRLGADYNDIEGEDASTEQTFLNLRVGIADRLGSGWRWQYDGRFREVEDDLRLAASRELMDHELGIGRSFSVRQSRGDAKLGFVVRDQDGAGAFESWSPVLDLSLRSRRHAIQLHLSFLDQDLQDALTDELRYATQRLAYTFTFGRHALSLELGQELRRPAPGLETESRRAGLRYRVGLDGLP